MLIKPLLVVAGFLIIRSMYYGYYWWMMHRYEGIYTRFIFDGKATKLRLLKTQIKRAVNVAGVMTYEIPTVEPMGWGKLASFKISPLDNLSNRREDVVQMNEGMFLDAIGTLRAKTFESVNPVYWIELIVFLPSKFFGYFGADPHKGVIKALQAVWWLIAAVSTVSGLVFNEQLLNWMRSL